MIGLQWQPGKDKQRKKPAPVVITQGPSTSRTEREAPRFDPFAAYGMPMKRKPGRPRK